MESQNGLNNRVDCCLAGEEKDCGRGRPRPPAKTLFFNVSGLVWVVAIALAVVLSAGPAFGQFIIQPMRMYIPVRPGRIIKTPLKLSSVDPNAVHTIDFNLVELSQWEDGSWRVIEPNVTDPNHPDFGFDVSKLSSCREWIKLARDTVVLDPLDIDEVEVSLRVPRGIRGFYVAGIVASLQHRPGIIEGGVGVIVQFLVPVLVEVQSRMPMRHNVEYLDIGLESIESNGYQPATTQVSVNVANNGGTFSSLKVITRLRGFSSGHWRQITETELPGAGIIPGAKLKLRGDIGRILPPGQYMINGALYVDGRLAKTFAKEIDFAGHPSAKKDVAGDAPLILNSREVFISTLPGATRRGVLKVLNSSDETVNVQASLALPSGLENRVFGNVRGGDLDCSQWVKIKPDKFTLRSGAQQSIGIVTTMPSPVEAHPYYYAVLRLQSTYPDGQNAGVTAAYTCVENSTVEASPSAHIQTMTLAAGAEPSKYLVVVRGGNFGIVHFTPRCRVAVTEPDTGRNMIMKLLGSNRSGLMLPLEARDFSEILDFSRIPSGVYRVTAALEYAPDVITERQMAIRVSGEGGGQRFVEIMQLEEELAQKIEVQW